MLGICDITIRRYDFRHHAVSKALRNPNVSAEGAKAYFGWVNPKMFERYGHMNRKTLDIVAAAMSSEKPVPPVKPRPKRKATVVEMVPRRVVGRNDQLCLPAPKESP